MFVQLLGKAVPKCDQIDLSGHSPLVVDKFFFIIADYLLFL